MTQLSMYHLNEEYLDLMEAFDKAQSEEEIDDALEVLQLNQGDLEAKMDDYIAFLRHLKSVTEEQKAEENRIKERRQGVEKLIERLKETMQQAMTLRGQQKIKTSLNTVYIQMNPPKLDISEHAKIPDTFYIPQAPKLDKKALKDYIKADHTLPGVKLKQTESLRFK
ncbi:MAG: siphovirus Gp157 family protein [Aerococcus sp.]|nr:siphovirus Gp157 family protein [Aerococcus sp.]